MGFRIEQFETETEAMEYLEKVKKLTDLWTITRISDSPKEFDGKYWVMWTEK